MLSIDGGMTVIELIDFDQWIKPKDLSEASGTSEKMWLRSPDGEKTGLFKFPKVQDYPGRPESISTEHISEWIASQIGERLDVTCAKVKLGYRDGRIGSLSVLVPELSNSSAALVEGVNFIKEKYPQYDANAMMNVADNTYYCLEHILNATKDYLPTQFWVKVLLFDFLIGNSDRHHSNWALLKQSDQQYAPCPLYDNGSSLCSYVTEEQMERLFSKDAGPMKRQTDSGSCSRIRIDGHIKKIPTHKMVIQHILIKYPRITVPIAQSFLKYLTPDQVDSILVQIPADIFSTDRKQLVSCFLTRKLEILSRLLEEGESTYG